MKKLLVTLLLSIVGLPWACLAPVVDGKDSATGVFARRAQGDSGLHPRQVTTYLADELSPKLSSSGRDLIYVSNRGGNRDIWSRPLAGGLPRRITDHSADDYDPDISPDDKCLAFASNRMDAKGDIFIVRLDGSNLIRLTGRESGDRQPDFFPDGDRVAFARFEGGASRGIFTVGLENHEIERLTRRPGSDPAISPDGRWLVFTSMSEEAGNPRPCLWIRDMTDGRETLLTGCDRPEGFASWVGSEGGDWLVFNRFNDDTNADGHIDLGDRPSVWKIRFAGSPRGSSAKPLPLTPGISADIMPVAGGGRVFYSSRTEKDLDIWSVPLKSDKRPGSCATVSKLAREREDPLEGLFILRRAGVLQREASESQRCVLGEADILLKWGRRAQAADLYARLAAQALETDVRNQALLGHVAAAMEERLPVGMSPSEQEEKRPVAKDLLEALGKIEIPPERQRFVKADILRRVGRFSAALEALELPVDQTGSKATRARALILKGDVLQTLGNSDQALTAYVGSLGLAGAGRDLQLRAARRVLDLAGKQLVGGLAVRDPVERLESVAQQWQDLAVLPALARLAIAELHLEAGREKLARRAFRLAEMLGDEQPEIVSRALTGLSDMAEKAGDLSEALDHANELIERFPANRRTRILARRRIKRLAGVHARDLLAKGELGMAIKVYRQLIAQEPDDVVAHRHLIACMAQLGRQGRAVDMYLERLEKKPGDGLSLYLYGLSLTYLDPPGHFGDAADAIEQALSVNSQLAFAHQTLGWLHEQWAKIKDDQEELHLAAERYQAALSLLDTRNEPRCEADLLLNLGNVHYSLGDYRQAHAFYRRRHQSGQEFLHPERHAVFLEQFGRSALLTGNFEEAEHSFSTAAGLYSKLGKHARIPWLVASRAAACQLDGRFTRAAEIFRKACGMYAEAGRHDRMASCHRNLAYNLYMAGNTEKAAAEFARARNLLHKYESRVEKGGESVSVSLADSASRAAYGFDRDGELNFLYSFQAKLFSQAGDLVRAGSALHRKAELLGLHARESDDSGLLLDQAVATSQLAGISVRAGDFSRAMALFEKAGKLAHGASSTRGVAVNSLNRLDLVLTHKANLDARQIITELLNALNQVDVEGAGNKSLEVRLLNALGTTLAANTSHGGSQTGAEQESLNDRIEHIVGSLDKSLRSLTQAEKYLVKAFEFSASLKNRSGARLRACAGWNLADVQGRLGKTGEAERTRQTVKRLVDELELSGIDWRLEEPGRDHAERAAILSRLPPGFAGTAKDVMARWDRDMLFQRLVAQAMRKGTAEEAFLWAEKHLARCRLDSIEPGDFVTTSDGDDAYLEGLSKRQAGLIGKMDLPLAAGDGQDAALSAKRVSQALDEFVEFRDHGGDPSAHLRHVFSAATRTVGQVRGSLGDGEALLKIVPLPRTLLLMWLDKQGFSVERLEVGRRELDAELAAIGSRDKEGSAKARAHLSKWILNPLANRLAKVDSLFVVSGGLDVPVGFLVYEGESLLCSVPVVHLYMASDLPLVRARRNLNLKRALWVGKPPDKRTQATIKGVYGSLRTMEDAGEAAAKLAGAGLVVWSVAINQDPGRPMLTALDPDRELGSIGGVSLAELASRARRSGLWVFEGLETGNAHGLFDAGLEMTMLGARVPAVLVLPAAAGEKTTGEILRSMIAGLPKHKPARALSQTVEKLMDEGVSWRELLNLRMYGDPGMNRQERVEYAETSLATSVGRAMAAYKKEDWADALASFLEVRTLAVYLDRKKVLPTIDRRIVQCAFSLAEYDLAIEYQHKILVEAQKSDNRLLIAQARRFLGILESRAGRHSRATAWLEKAVEEFESLGKSRESAATTATLALAHDASSAYNKAVAAARDALEGFRRLGDDAQVLRMMRLIGTTYLKRLNMATTAGDWFSSALELARKRDQPDKVAAVLLDQARTESASGAYDRALHLAREAERISKKLSDAKARADALLEQAKGLWYLGEYQRAFDAQRRCLSLARDSGSARQVIMALSLGGLIAMNLGDLEKAGQSLQEALDGAREAGLSDEVAVQLNNLGIVARERGDLEEAVELFERALEIDKRLKSKLGIAYDYRNIGIVEHMLGRNEQASRRLQMALELTREVGDRFNEAKVLHGMARQELLAGQLARAHEHARAAHDISVDLGLKEVTWRSLRTMGQIAWQRDQLQGARAYFSQAIDVVERMRASLKVEQFRSGFLDNKYDLYADIIHLLMDLGSRDEAFYLSERSRARGFLDLLANRRIELGAASARELLKQVRKRKEAISRLGEELRRLEGDEKKKAREQLGQARKTYRRLMDELRRNDPELADLVEVKPATPEDLRSRLDDDVALLAFYVTEKSIVAWLVTSDKTSGRRIDMERKKLVRRVRNLRRAMENFSPVDKILAGLYDRLVRPFEKELEGIRVVGVLPHDVLHYLPFAALKPGADSYWVDKVRLFTCPSASVLVSLIERHQNRMGPLGGMLALGNPALGKPGLELPFSAHEASALGLEQAGSEVLLRAQATEAAVHEKAPSCEFLHLAGHGVFDSLSPLNSAILLAPGAGQDGRLTALEVFSLTLSAGLVSLSACQTGLGQVSSGDEVIGLNRAFLTAGASSVLSSLWRVSDVATAVLMKRFYRLLRRHPAPTALYRAQAKVREYYSHPAYWSGFVLAGTWF